MKVKNKLHCLLVIVLVNNGLSNKTSYVHMCVQSWGWEYKCTLNSAIIVLE